MVGRKGLVLLVYLDGVIRSRESQPFHTPNQFVSSDHEVGATSTPLHYKMHTYKISCL